MLELVQRSLAQHDRLDEIGPKILAIVAEFRGGDPSEDDETLIVARTLPYIAKPFQLGERLKVIGKLLRVLDFRIERTPGRDRSRRWFVSFIEQARSTALGLHRRGLPVWPRILTVI